MISYHIFKDCLLEWLNKTEKMLSSILGEEDPYLIGDRMKNEMKAEFGTHNNENNFRDLFTGYEIDINMMILHRSLYILKRKFDVYQKEIYEIYRKYMEKNKTDYIIDINKFRKIFREVIISGKFLMMYINKPGDLFKAELMSNISQDKTTGVLKSLNHFMVANRKKYNDIMRQKKKKGFVKLNENDNNKEEKSLDLDWSRMTGGSQVKEKETGKEISKEKEGDKITDANHIDKTVLNRELKPTNSEEIDPQNDKSGNEELVVSENREGVIDQTANPDNNKEIAPETNTDNIEAGDQPISPTADPQEDLAIDPTTGSPLVPIPEEILQPAGNSSPSDSHKEIDTNKAHMANPIDDDIKSIINEDSTNSENFTAFQKENYPTINIIPSDSKMNQLNLSNIPKSRRVQFLYIEVLPLIIADFIQENSGIVILDVDEEMKGELRTLFDTEIIRRLGELVKDDVNEEKTSKLKDLLLEKMNLEKNLKFYEDLYVQKQSKKENTQFIVQILVKLKTQRVWLENKIKTLQEDNDLQGGNIQKENIGKNKMIKTPLEKSNIISNSILTHISQNVSKIIPRNLQTKDQRRTNAIKEIFFFYSRQHHLVGNKPTFDAIKSKIDHMDLSEFSKFCVEFRIFVKKEKLVEIFHKTSENLKHLSLDEFFITLQKISVAVNEEKKSILYKRMTRYKQNLKDIDPEYNQPEKLSPKNEDKQGNLFGKPPNESQGEKSEEEVGNSNSPNNQNSSVENEKQPQKVESPKLTNKKKIAKKSSIILFTNKSDLLEEIQKCRQNIEILSKKTYQQLVEELYIYMELDDEQVCHRKMKGFILPFQTHDKTYRIPNDVLMQKAKVMDIHTADEIQRILAERKHQKESEKKEHERREKNQLYEYKVKQFSVKDKIAKEHERTRIGKNSNYQDIKTKYEIFSKEKEIKMTWEQLEKMDTNYFQTNREDDFHPEEFFDNGYDSDDAELLLGLHAKEEKSKPPAKEKENNNYNHINNNLLTSLQNESIDGANVINKPSSIESTKLDSSKDISKNQHPKVNYVNQIRSKSNEKRRQMKKKNEQALQDVESYWDFKKANVIKKFENMNRRKKK